MSFVFPGFLFALFAISIPVIIHLFRFRRFRTVYFPNTAFLRQLSEASDKESRLKHLLILLLRILTIAFLVLAFARPFIASGDEDISPGGNVVGVYIDNSFSMNAMSARGRLLDEARERALELAGIYGPADRFLLLTNDFEGRHQRFVSREEFVDLVAQVDESAATRSIVEVMQRKQELFSEENEDNQRAYYISDFQQSTSGIETLESEPEPSAYLIPIEAQQLDNVFIDSCWFESPVRLAGEPVTMHVRIRNEGLQNLENQSLRLYIEGRQRSVVAYNVAAGNTVETELSWSAGTDAFQQGYLEIVDYPVTFDDRLYFTYTVSSEIPVLSLDGEGSSPYLQALYGSDELFNFRTMPGFSIDYSVFPNYPLIILNGFNQLSAGLGMELQRYVEEGGSLVIFPGIDVNLMSYNELLLSMNLDSYAGRDTAEIRVSEINELHPLFEDVFEHIPENIDLPVLSNHYPIQRQVRSAGETLLQLQNGMPFLSSYRTGEGTVYLSAVPLDNAFSNFQRHSIFVPVMVNIALHSGAMQPLYHTIEPNLRVLMPGSRAQTDRVFSLRSEGFEVIPEVRRPGNQMQLLFHDQVAEADNYSLFLGEEHVGALSFNYDRRESLPASYDSNALEDMLADLQLETLRVVAPGDRSLERVFTEMGMGRQLWRLFLLLALATLLAEVLIIRFWK